MAPLRPLPCDPPRPPAQNLGVATPQPPRIDAYACGIRTAYLINLENLLCVDIIKCQVKFCLLLDFLDIILFLTILASTGGPHEISRRAAGWTALQ